MKNLIITFALCIFLAGNAFSATDILRGKGDTLFIRDVKSFEKTVSYDSAGYRSSLTTIFGTAYKVVDTVFMDSVSSRKFGDDLILEAITNNNDTLFSETKILSVYKRSDWFSIKNTKIETPYLFYDRNTKMVTGSSIVVFEEKATYWKLVTIFAFIIFIPFLFVKRIFKLNDFEDPKKIPKDLKIASFISFNNFVSFAVIALICNMVVGIPIQLLLGFTTVLEAVGSTTVLEGYSHWLWWARFAVEYVILGLFFYFEAKKHIQKMLAKEKPDSIPDSTAGSE